MTVRLNNTDVMYPKETVQLSGLSTDTKPTGTAAANFATGSSFMEVDTGNVFLYDEDNDTWHEL